ncbi:hypothetical protein QJS10_CPB20g01799 [Acorus calamus]|uniref:Uncharacterized protein n=1 Tax=Acorus calamus TaxID=4465 RepID=A0AAV9C983_ACOCL|nr:hypothetical protein QJS10_CPB20g01799 [Acorus calamus]
MKGRNDSGYLKMHSLVRSGHQLDRKACHEQNPRSQSHYLSESSKNAKVSSTKSEPFITLERILRDDPKKDPYPRARVASKPGNNDSGNASSSGDSSPVKRHTGGDGRWEAIKVAKAREARLGLSNFR